MSGPNRSESPGTRGDPKGGGPAVLLPFPPANSQDLQGAVDRLTRERSLVRTQPRPSTRPCSRSGRANDRLLCGVPFGFRFLDSVRTLPELQDPHGPGDADARRCDLGRGVHLRNRRSQGIGEPRWTRFRSSPQERSWDPGSYLAVLAGDEPLMVTLVDTEEAPAPVRSVSIVLADDHEVVRNGLRMVLEGPA
jgi:hypothetical protein